MLEFWASLNRAAEKYLNLGTRSTEIFVPKQEGSKQVRNIYSNMLVTPPGFYEFRSSNMAVKFCVVNQRRRSFRDVDYYYRICQFLSTIAKHDTGFG